MDLRALGAFLSFCVQVAAGAAPVKWPQYTWLADIIFWGACLIGVVCLFWWFRANYRLRLPWISQSEASNSAKGETQAAFVSYPPKVTISPPSLSRSLYVGEIRFTLSELEKDRHSELTMRVFNGSGRVVEIGKVSGHIKFNAPNTTDPTRTGELPPPALRHDTAKTAIQLEEWFLIFSQRVPANEADKILMMLKTEIPILFDLSGLTIEVFPQENPAKIERLPIWSGVSYSRGNGFGRIIAVAVKAGVSTVATIG